MEVSPCTDDTGPRAAASACCELILYKAQGLLQGRAPQPLRALFFPSIKWSHHRHLTVFLGRGSRSTWCMLGKPFLPLPLALPPGGKTGGCCSEPGFLTTPHVGTECLRTGQVLRRQSRNGLNRKPGVCKPGIGSESRERALLYLYICLLLKSL